MKCTRGVYCIFVYKILKLTTNYTKWCYFFILPLLKSIQLHNKFIFLLFNCTTQFYVISTSLVNSNFLQFLRIKVIDFIIIVNRLQLNMTSYITEQTRT